MAFDILISNGKSGYYPPIEDGATWVTERKGTPGRLDFKCLADGALKMEEGNSVKLTVDGKDVFYGFIFTQKRYKEQRISVTAYDQLRYLKNKDTYVYSSKTASQLIGQIASDFRLRAGTIENTGYVIPKRIEEDSTLFDIIQSALDITLMNKGTLYVLFDDVGKLTLKNISSLRVPIQIDADTGENFDYATSIDDSTYNQIKLTREDKDTGKRDVWMTKDSSNINRWGVLQYYEKRNDNENGQMKAEALIRLYNQRTKNLRVSKACGDVRVRAGSLVYTMLELGDTTVNSWLLCERVSHNFEHGLHTMDLTLRGGEFVG